MALAADRTIVVLHHGHFCFILAASLSHVLLAWVFLMTGCSAFARREFVVHLLLSILCRVQNEIQGFLRCGFPLARVWTPQSRLSPCDIGSMSDKLGINWCFQPQTYHFSSRKNEPHAKKHPTPCFFWLTVFVAFATPSQPGLRDGSSHGAERRLWGHSTFGWALLTVNQHEPTVVQPYLFYQMSHTYRMCRYAS